MGKHREHIAKTISYYRKSLGIKQSDLAKKLNVAPSSISAWENGSNAPDIETLAELCDIFNISMNEMYGINDGKNHLSVDYSSDKETPVIIAASTGGLTNVDERANELLRAKQELCGIIYAANLDMRQIQELKYIVNAFENL
nr:MAG TPA: helix-turn-helix domain protein [Bacteriophage sp.]